jgi:hypothetical protein
VLELDAVSRRYGEVVREQPPPPLPVRSLEVALSVVVLLASTVALVLVAARIYANAVLRTGTRVRLLEAWRAPQT